MRFKLFIAASCSVVILSLLALQAGAEQPRYPSLPRRVLCLIHGTDKGQQSKGTLDCSDTNLPDPNPDNCIGQSHCTSATVGRCCYTCTPVIDGSEIGGSGANQTFVTNASCSNSALYYGACKKIVGVLYSCSQGEQPLGKCSGTVKQYTDQTK
jgi:hypothetical protein